MSYAALMVHFDESPSAHRRLRLAVELASRFRAALIGIAGRLYLPSFLAGEIASGDEAGNAEQQETMSLLASIETKFRAGAKQVDKVEWRGSLDYVNKLVPREARAADLVIVGRSAVPADLYYALDPGATILSAGRPVLLVPDAIDLLPARRAVIAWKDCREARRAVQDALPLLREAKEVLIVHVCERATEQVSQVSINDVADYLLRHKINVEGKAFLRTEQPIASEILRFAGNEKADFVVAGGYGHGRLGEWMFGGVTRELLADAPLCCLFSH